MTKPDKNYITLRNHHEEMNPLLNEATPGDIHISEYLQTLSDHNDDELAALIQCLMIRMRSGDICLKVHEVASPEKNVVPCENGDSRAVSSRLLKFLQNTDMVSDGSGDRIAPLVLKQNRLYTGRYFDYEQTVILRILNNLKLSASNNITVSNNISRTLNALFPENDDSLKGPSDQKIAALMAEKNAFMLLTGGPGTGKTTTVVKLLTLLLSSNPDLRIALGAPTGKAALRLTHSINHAKENLPVDDDIKKHIPDEVYTLHRLLGTVPGSPFFRHNKHRPLPVDLLVVDEASMIDLPLLAKTINALSPDAGIILIGDKDQLASVESGAVLGDICESISDQHSLSAFSSEKARNMESQLSQKGTIEIVEPDLLHPLGDYSMELRKNWRFDENSGIGNLARAVREKDFDTVMDILKSDRFSDVNIISNEKRDTLFRESLLRETESYKACDNPHECLLSLDRFRVLSPLRAGLTGVENLNQYIASVLHDAGIIRTAGRGAHFHKRPLLITENDYHLRLFNGDTGIVLEENGKKSVYFHNYEEESGKVRAIIPERLGPHETCFAMTVHKSQGSEFEHVTLVMPDTPNPVMTSELIYTAITRARSSFELFCSESALRESLKKSVVRNSGIAEELRKR